MPAQKNQTDKTAYMELRKAIKEKNIEGIYVLYGDEDYLREYYFRQMKQIICDGSFDEFNYKQFDGKDVDLPALSDAIDSLPVFAEKTFIELRDMELSKCSESRKNQFAEIIRDLPSYCCLVLIYSSGSIGLDKRSSLYSLLKKTAKIVEFTLQNDSDLTKWIYRRFLDAGHEIKRNEAEYLIFLCGGFMTNLISEIEKNSCIF